jgi:hypothetical protein
MTDLLARKERNEKFKIHSDTLFWEMFVLECQDYAKLAFILEGLAPKMESFRDIKKEVT